MFLVAVFVTAGAGTDRDSYLQRNAYENGGGWGGESYNGMLYSSENELTVLRASTVSQNYDMEQNQQITRDDIWHDTTYAKPRFLQMYLVVSGSGAGRQW